MPFKKRGVVERSREVPDGVSVEPVSLRNCCASYSAVDFCEAELLEEDDE